MNCDVNKHFVYLGG